MRVLQAFAFASLSFPLIIVESSPSGPSPHQSSENFFDDGRRAHRAGTFPMPDPVARRAKSSNAPSGGGITPTGFDDLVISPTEPNERGKRSETSKGNGRQMADRAGGPEERIVPDNAADNSVVLFPEFDVPQLVMGSTFCEFEINKPKYTEEQNQCVKSRIDTIPAYDYINLVQSEEFTLAMKGELAFATARPASTSYAVE